MFNKIDSDDCLANVVKRWHEKLMQQNRNQVCKIKQSEIIQMSINNVDNIKNSDQWELQKLHQLITNNEKTELNNDEWVLHDVEFDR